MTSASNSQLLITRSHADVNNKLVIMIEQVMIDWLDCTASGKPALKIDRGTTSKEDPPMI